MRQNIILGMLACCAACSGPAEVQASTRTETPMYIAVDVSASNPFMDEDAKFAGRAINAVRQELKTAPLRRGDWLELTTIGGSASSEIYQQSGRVKSKPSQAINGLSRLLAKVAKGGIEPQSVTRIWDYFANTSFACTTGSLVLVITDGYPTGEPEAQADKLLRGEPGAIRPLPGALTNCEVVFVGLSKDQGQHSGTQKVNLRAGWQAFVEASGGKYRAVATR